MALASAAPGAWPAVDIYCETPDRQLVGQVRVSPSGAHAVLIENLAVEEPYRGQGLGVRLVAEALRVGGLQGRGRAWLEADDKGSGRLLRWYRALGFRDIGRGPRGRPALEANLEQALPALQRQLRVAGPTSYVFHAVHVGRFTARGRPPS